MLDNSSASVLLVSSHTDAELLSNMMATHHHVTVRQLPTQTGKSFSRSSLLGLIFKLYLVAAVMGFGFPDHTGKIVQTAVLGIGASVLAAIVVDRLDEFKAHLDTQLGNQPDASNITRASN